MATAQQAPARSKPFPLVSAGAALLVLLYAAYWFLARPDYALMRQMWFLPGIGVIGATIANTSGTGGGVVFVPVFLAMREWGLMSLTPIQVTAASFGIQSLGMSMGSLRWTDRLLRQPLGEAAIAPRDYFTVVLGVLALSLPAMLLTQRLFHFDPHDILIGYKLFSILLGSGLVIATWTVNRSRPERARLERVDMVVLLVLAIPGGFITALFSVGIGELVALYLFTRHYPVLLCTGAACVISAISVLSGLVWHVGAGTVPWEVVLLAAPGAALGGFVARPLALWLGARRLKTIDGMWIVLSSFYLIWLNWR
jgi:uncharacterized membrane protein YfcA